LKKNWSLYLVLLFVATSWGLTNPLAKIAVSSGYMPLGVMFWQLTVILVFSGALTFLTHRRFPFRRDTIGLFIGIACFGTLIPDYLLYLSAAHLPAGIFSILLGLTPVFAMPVAVLLGFDKFEIRRVLGVALGALAIAVMFGPEASLPSDVRSIFVVLTLISAMCYAVQGNFLTWHGGADLDPVQILFGSSMAAFLAVVPSAILSNQFVDLLIPWSRVEWAILATSVLHAFAYGGFFMLVTRGGPVFASQAAYLVTGSGVLWSMLLLGETYSAWVWVAFALMLAGIVLLQPKKAKPAR
jgi:drug/metabolite transporter (DMT)-like permease